MSFAEVLQELPSLTLRQRQQLVRCTLDLDDLPLSSADERLVENRLAAHRKYPDTAVSLVSMKSRLRSQFKK